MYHGQLEFERISYMEPEIPNPYQSNFSFITGVHEADKQEIQAIDERKQRRMVSNRESARRSRMRKQRCVDELWTQVTRLRNENHKLIESLSRASECHDKALRENVQLKKETSDLHQMLGSLQILHPYNVLRSMEEFPSSTDDLSFESWSESSGNYVDLLD